MLINEVKTEAVQQWLMDRLDQDLAISDWTSTEFSSFARNLTLVC
jgi:hypothetical protein